MATPQPPDQPPYSPPPIETASQPAPPTDPGEVTQQHAEQVAAQQQAAAQAQQAAAQTAQQPYAQQPYYGYTQPGYQQPYQQQYQQPYAYPQQGAYYAQPGNYQPYYGGPDNGLATGSLVTAIISVAALVFTAGFSAPLSLIASIVSIFLGHKGKKAVDEGRTQKNRDTAVAGFWTGIAGVVLSVLAIAAWVIFFVAIASTGGEADPGDLASLWDALGPILGA